MSLQPQDRKCAFIQLTTLIPDSKRTVKKCCAQLAITECQHIFPYVEPHHHTLATTMTDIHFSEEKKA